MAARREEMVKLWLEAGEDFVLEENDSGHRSGKGNIVQYRIGRLNMG